tara:strand:- start:2259 stop:2513 length:255 start_codon:yes stop_codon:yes gene_type:complete
MNPPNEMPVNLKDANKCIKHLRTEIKIMELEHIQDIVAINYAYGVSIEESLNQMDRLDLLDWLSNKETGLNTELYALGHALNAA